MTNLFKKPLFWIIVIVLIFAGVSLYFSNTNKKVVTSDVAIRVNNSIFTKDEFDEILEQVRKDFETYGMTVSEEEMREEAINRATTELLVLEHAIREGIEVTEEEVREKINDLMMVQGFQSEEEFFAELEIQGFKVKEVERFIALEIIINKLTDLYSKNIEIEESDLKDAYDMYVLQMEEFLSSGEYDEEISSLEEVESLLREQLIQEETTMVIFSKIEELRNELEIEIFVK